jgi:hypothetical protein
MKIEYMTGNRVEVKQAEFYCVGNSIVMRPDNSRVEHRMILSEGQWKLLAEIAQRRASGEEE